MNNNNKQTMLVVVVAISFFILTFVISAILSQIAPAAPDFATLVMSVFSSIMIMGMILSGGSNDAVNFPKSFAPVCVVTSPQNRSSVVEELKRAGLIPVEIVT